MPNYLTPNHDPEELFNRSSLIERLCDKLRGHKHIEHDPEPEKKQSRHDSSTCNPERSQAMGHKVHFTRVDGHEKEYNPSLAEMVGDKIREWRERKERARIRKLKDEWLRRQRLEREIWEDTVEHMGEY